MPKPARVKLTKPMIAKAEPREKQYILWDSEVPGLGVYVNKASKTFFIDYFTADRQRRRMTLRKFGQITIEQARSQAQVEFGKVAAGEDPLQSNRDKKARRDGLTVAQLCDEYITAAEAGRVFKRRSRTPKKASTIATDKGRVDKHIKPLLGKKLVADLTQRDVQQFVDDVTDGKTAKVEKSGKPRGVARVTGGAGTASRTVGLLGGILSWGIRQGALQFNPAHGVDRAADQKRERRLTPDELRALGKALSNADTEAWQAVAGIRLLALTGARLSEIVKLRWSEVDLESQALVYGDTKTGQSLRPLGMAAIDVLRSTESMGGDGFVLPGIRNPDGAYGSMDTAMERITAKAELEGVTAHVLRHTFASIAGDLEYSDGTIGALIGHKGHTITSKYTHRLDAVLVAAANKVSAEVWRQMTGQGGNVIPMPKRA